MVAWRAKIQRGLAFGSLTLALGCTQNGNPTSALEEPTGRLVQRAEAGGRTWSRTQTLLPDSPSGTVPTEPSARFGAIVALSGTTAVVGGWEHSVFVYTLSNRSWIQQQELVTNGEIFWDGSHQSAAVSGDTVIVGTPREWFGAAEVFTRSGSTWTHTQQLTGKATSFADGFGAAVAVEGDLMVVGAPLQEAAYVFARTGDQWTEQKQLFGNEPIGGQFPSAFGAAVAISGRSVVVGAPEARNSVLGSAGKIYVFTAPAELTGTWQATELVPTTRRVSERFGRSVAASEDAIVAGAPLLNGASVFMKDGADWGHQSFSVDRFQPGDAFGHSLATSGNRIVIGAPKLRTSPRVFPGGAFVYVRDPSGGWFPEQDLIATLSEGNFGSAVGLAGDTLIVGAPGVGATGAAHVYELLADLGNACETNADCDSRHCVAGVCCNTACDGACAECRTGECVPVPSGNPGNPSCGTLVCDGLNEDCPRSCGTNGDCLETHYCRDGECSPKAPEGTACVGPDECQSDRCIGHRCTGTRPNGSRCTDGVQCGRGHCVDGVCCNDACTDQCEACDVRGREGECVPVDGAPHGEREPCAGAGSPCGGRCNGTVTDACEYPSVSEECDSICENAEETISTCNGQGVCIQGTSRTCGKFACDGSVRCNESCDVDADCASELRCWNDGTCDSDGRCVGEHLSARAPEGELEDCGRYVCDPSNGSCKTSCVQSSDCAVPYVCERQECVPVPSGSDGCGCRTVSPRSGRAWLLGVLALPLVFARRRARRLLAQEAR